MPLETAASQLVVQILSQLIPDGALGVGSTGVERHLVQDLLGDLRAQQDEPHLWPVAVGDHDPVSCRDDARDMSAGLSRGPILIVDRHVLGIPDQRVAADGDGDEFLHDLSLVRDPRARVPSERCFGDRPGALID